MGSNPTLAALVPFAERDRQAPVPVEPFSSFQRVGALEPRSSATGDFDVGTGSASGLFESGCVHTVAGIRKGEQDANQSSATEHG